MNSCQTSLWFTSPLSNQMESKRKNNEERNSRWRDQQDRNSCSLWQSEFRLLGFLVEEVWRDPVADIISSITRWWNTFKQLIKQSFNISNFVSIPKKPEYSSSKTRNIFCSHGVYSRCRLSIESWTWTSLLTMLTVVYFKYLYLLTFSTFFFSIFASALNSRASSASGFICYYPSIQCADVAIPTPLGNDETCVNLVLPVNQCLRTTDSFESFVAGISVNCASGRTPQVITYFTTDCTGPGISAGVLPANGPPSQCFDMVPQPGPNVQGQSARFGCLCPN